MSGSEIKPLLDALDFCKFTDRAIGNKFTEALKALDLDLQEAEGGPYEPGSEAEQVFNELAAEIADALEKLDEDEEVKEVVLELEEEGEDAELDDDKDEEEELEDQSSALDDESLNVEDEAVDAEVIKPE